MSDYKKSFTHICESNTCNECKFNMCEDEQDICEHEGFYKCGYQQGRADAIDEFAKYIDKHSHISADGCDICLDDDITILAEQIKEQKNEQK